MVNLRRSGNEGETIRGAPRDSREPALSLSKGRLSPHKLSLHQNEELLRDAVLFALRAQDAVDGVRRPAAGLVVVADLHFAEQADG